MYLTLDDRRTSQRDAVCLDGALETAAASCDRSRPRPFPA